MNKKIIIEEIIKELRLTLQRSMPSDEADKRVEFCANLLETIINI